MQFSPTRYYKGLSKTKKIQRKKEISRYGKLNWKNPNAYVGFKTNIGIKTKQSKYIQTLRKKIQAKSLQEKAKTTGVPYRFLKQSYNRGMAAWRTGHRPGATPQQWGHARVASLLVCGKTHYSTDADLVKKAKKKSVKARNWWRNCDS